MSKSPIVYTCDGHDCKNKTTDLKTSQWLEISANENSLAIKNHFKHRKLISLDRYEAIHFCSPNCLLNYFYSDPSNETK